MAKVSLQDYIHILDRFLEREGLAEVERDEVFNDDNNSEIITAAFRKRVHPKKIVDKLDRRPVEAMYANVNEAREMPTEYPPGQQYAMDFLKAAGFKFISGALQASRGNLVFRAPDGTTWAIFRNGGYIRKWRGHYDERKNDYHGEWSVMHKSLDNAQPIEDDEYMDLVHILTEKYRRSVARKRKKEDPDFIAKKEKRDFYKRSDKIYNQFEDIIEKELLGYKYSVDNPNEEIKRAIKKLYKKYNSS